MDLEKIVSEIYEEVRQNRAGKVADYIPQLAKVNPDLFGVSICTTKGEFINFGETNFEFCLQSTSKPLNYCIARELTSKEKVHHHVGYEPSGRAFNAHVLNKEGLPHNPMINAGAIMVCSLIEPHLEPAERFERIKEYLVKMSGGKGKIGFDNSVFLSENFHADRNRSLAYFMRENKAFPQNADMERTLALYFQGCSITLNCETMASIAATLANNGVSPVSQEKVLTGDTVQDCLSLMYMCGMYDFSGQFAFEIGLPAKSGVSGCLFVVIPNQMGICIWSPRLDECGNTVRGVDFCRKLVERLDCHIFHNVIRAESGLITPHALSQALISAACEGDVEQIRKLAEKVSVNQGDYDGRTPLHLACAEGNVDAIEVLLELGAEVDAKDRWGNSSLYEAHQAKIQGKMSEEDYERLFKN
jgi:glutaminase